MFKKNFVFIAMIFVCSLLVHCPWDKKKDDSDLMSVAALLVLGNNQGIQFSAYAGTQKLECGATLKGHASVLETVPFVPNAHIAESTTFQLHDFRLFVHGISLIQNSGEEIPLSLNQDGKFQSGDIALLDFENKTGKCNGTSETNHLVSAFITPGAYKGIKFIVGLPENKNHLDADNQLPPLNNSGMYWSWTSGYKFLKLDFETAETLEASIHIGSANCVGTGSSSSCARANRIPVTLTPDDGFNPSTQEIKINVQALLQGIDLQTNANAAMCMSGIVGATSIGCPIIFANIGLDLNAGTPITPVRTVFSIKAKD
ncbi:MbnP family copper-binding protein [Leptospira borgpetersenii]|uniref:MbnP family copper-binding protein n=1 Tax=Leptospira borgpetersenii TaxID=174 RepID=UPI0007737717|nr:MbnP family copper-binding protein [Leptospira borgpetersenii]MBE8399797.1 metallo-mystery pair system four-Cys motif protein [Leptospira borgpetersenii serovar Tarassovi]MBE8402948.1 metallo-mystery pair system four-Cys motif protein [Leptospira borgpetersenii serovar Tarassovi]MBE8406055.1 metallo-mystery pair system four-Cys motif protein [Leptospira borgpetersenii serovar Tarassovi]MBE8412340.1 metallo-mystery pair system four-Cys motif protein [Leptospira borgpetersenii serovar Tarassov